MIFFVVVQFNINQNAENKYFHQFEVLRSTNTSSLPQHKYKFFASIRYIEINTTF